MDQRRTWPARESACERGRVVRRIVGSQSAAAFAMLALSACGGGGSGDGTDSNFTAVRNSSGTGYVAGVYLPPAQFKGQCAAPRPGNSEDRPGSTLTENLWLRSWTHDTYLWYREVPDIDPTGYTASSYFPLLKTSALAPSGRPKDRYHYTYPTAEWQALAQSGIEVGYGIEWLRLSADWEARPRRVVVGYIHPNTPAARLANPVKRGEQVTSVNDVPIDNASLSQIGAALFPSAGGSVNRIGLRDPITNSVRVVQLTAEAVTLAPVLNVKTISTASGTVGYMQFNDFLGQSERALRDAVAYFQTQNVQDLIIDMRYNGGGYVAIASQLGYMLAGAAVTGGRTFEITQFNDKHPTTNPVTGQPIAPTPFYSTGRNFSVPSGQLLPSLNLQRVFVLTGPGTCSASESLINGLRGVDFPVIQIGSATCGKPYGFYGTDNCGTTYFTIQLRTVNEKRFGAYDDGFFAQNSSFPSSTPLDAVLPGCAVADDFTRELGDPLESRLAAALNYRAGGTCPAPTGLAQFGFEKQSVSAREELKQELDEELRVKSLLRENRWY